MAGVSLDMIVLEDAGAAARRAGEILADAARAGGHIALSGGKSPEQAHETAAKLQPDWSGVELWWGDERCVPPDDERSNYGLAKQALLVGLERPPGAVHRIRGELGKEAAASEYEHELGDAQLDLLLLGIGPDGHVASLFPNAPTLREERRVLPAEAGFEPYVDRVTLGLTTLCGAREILFLLAGEEKADAARRAFVDEATEATPASLVRARDGRTSAILDRAAAAKILA